MTQDRQHEAMIFECDICSAVFEGVKDESFEETWRKAKDAGWSARKGREGWEHSCQDCGKDALT